MGTIWAITTCRVEDKALPTTASSRTLRAAALARPFHVCFLSRIFLYSNTERQRAGVAGKGMEQIAT